VNVYEARRLTVASYPNRPFRERRQRSIHRLMKTAALRHPVACVAVLVAAALAIAFVLLTLAARL